MITAFDHNGFHLPIIIFAFTQPIIKILRLSYYLPILNLIIYYKCISNTFIKLMRKKEINRKQFSNLNL